MFERFRCHTVLPSDLGVLEDGALVVHALVVGLVVAADDAHPPVAVLEVPLDGLLDAVLELRLRLPTEFRVDLRRVDSIVTVVPCRCPQLESCDAKYSSRPSESNASHFADSSA